MAGMGDSRAARLDAGRMLGTGRGVWPGWPTQVVAAAALVWVGLAVNLVGMGQMKVAAASAEIVQAQQEAEKAIAAARERAAQARLKLWSFDEEHVQQVLDEAEKTLAESRADTADADNAESLAEQARMIADSTDVLAVDSRAAEARGVWVDDVILGYMDTPEMIRGMVRRLAQANINVIYVWTYEMGRTTYPSQYALMQEKQFQGMEEDPLAVLIDEAHKQGVEVQTWLALFSGGFNGQPGPLLQAHPDWADVTRSGKKLSYYKTTPMNPAYPPAREYLLNIVREIVTRYDIDGVHLDYIRYEDNGADDFGYHPWSIEQFNQEHGVDPRRVARSSPLGQKWVKWRQDQVTRFVQQVRELVNQIRPGTIVSAAVFAEPSKEAAQFRFQDWPLWVEQGLLDQVVPMDYQPDLNRYTEFARADRAAVERGNKTYWYQGIGQFQMDNEETARRIQLNRELGADGSVLFAMVYMKLDTYRTLQEGPWRLPAVLPTARPGATEAAVAAELNRLAERLAAVYLEAGATPDTAVATLVSQLRAVAQEAERQGSAQGSPSPATEQRAALGSAAKQSPASGLAGLQRLVKVLQESVEQLPTLEASAPAVSNTPAVPGEPAASGTSGASGGSAVAGAGTPGTSAVSTVSGTPGASAASGASGMSAVSPVTVAALRSELQYVQHLISVGIGLRDQPGTKA